MKQYLSEMAIEGAAAVLARELGLPFVVLVTKTDTNNFKVLSAGIDKELASGVANFIKEKIKAEVFAQLYGKKVTCDKVKPQQKAKVDSDFGVRTRKVPKSKANR